MYTSLFVPVLVPLTLHWYPGVIPPLTGAAVNVTEVPEQTGFAEAAIETLTGRDGFTVTEKSGEGVPEVQLLEGVTEILPETAEEETLTVIAWVFIPETIVKPPGSDHA